MKFVLSASCGCNTGKRRRNNEDNFYFDGKYLPANNNALEGILTCRYTGEKRTADFAVFDGMGGQADGQVASSVAASVFAQRVAGSTAFKDKEQSSFLRQTICAMTDAVWRQAESAFNDMGTTAAILRFSEDSWYLANVGDTRIFILRDGVLRQISQDHTDEQMLRETNMLNRKPQLTQYVGVSPEELTVEPYLTKGKVKVNDLFLICSDGLTDLVPGSQIASILSMNLPVALKAEELIRCALEKGGKDNVTVILIKAESAYEKRGTGMGTESLDSSNNEKGFSVEQNHINPAAAGAGNRSKEQTRSSYREADVSAQKAPKKSGLVLVILLLAVLIAAIVITGTIVLRNRAAGGGDKADQAVTGTPAGDSVQDQDKENQDTKHQDKENPDTEIQDTIKQNTENQNKTDQSTGNQNKTDQNTGNQNSRTQGGGEKKTGNDSSQPDSGGIQMEQGGNTVNSGNQ